jgi:hypothetical protein
VLPVVPVLGALLQGLVVAILVLLDETFEADVAADLVAQVVALEEEQEPRDPAVAVPERVDAQEDEMALSMRACSRSARSFCGDCLVNSSCLPSASPRSLRCQAVAVGRLFGPAAS